MMRKRKTKLSAALEAIDQGNIKKVEKSIYKLKDINLLVGTNFGPPTTLLCCAAKNNQIEIVKLLLRNSASVNKPDASDLYPIQYATEMNCFEITQLLLENGSFINYPKIGTLLHTASQFGRIEILSFILTKDINVDIANEQGDTALHVCVRHGHSEACKLLLGHGANINVQNVEGNTALHLSCIRKQVSTVDCIKTARLLLQHGARTDLKNNDGMLAIQLAYDNKIVRLFVEHRKLIEEENLRKMNEEKVSNHSTTKACDLVLKPKTDTVISIDENTISGKASELAENYSTFDHVTEASNQIEAARNKIVSTTSSNFSKFEHELQLLNTEIAKQRKEQEYITNDIQFKEHEITNLKFRLKQVEKDLACSLRLKKKMDSMESEQNGNESFGWMSKSLRVITRPVKLFSSCLGYI